MPNIDINKLKTLSRSSRLNINDRRMVADATKEVEALNKKVQVLEAQQKSKNQLKKNAVVKSLISDETKTLKLQIAELQKDKQQESRLKANPKVLQLIQKESDKKSKQAKAENIKLNAEIIKNKGQIKTLLEQVKANKTQPIQPKDFNQFLSSSIRDLQDSFQESTGNQNTDIIIRDVDIEATVITEMKNNQPVLVIPSREDMKELGSQNFQKVKYSLSVIPKDMDE